MSDSFGMPIVHDIVDELRQENLLGVPNLVEKVRKAADIIERQRQQIAELRSKLRNKKTANAEVSGATTGATE